MIYLGLSTAVCEPWGEGSDAAAVRLERKLHKRHFLYCSPIYEYYCVNLNFGPESAVMSLVSCRDKAAGPDTLL